MPDKTSEIVSNIIHTNEKLSEKLAKFIDVGAERGILSVLINCPDKFQEIISTFKVDHFQSKANKKLFEIILWLSKNRCEGSFVTPEQIFYEPRFHQDIQNIVGGQKYINALKQFQFNVNSYTAAKSVIMTKKAQRERFVVECEILGRLLDFEGESLEEVISIGTDEHFRFIESNVKDTSIVENISDGLRETLRERAANPVQIPGIPLVKYKHLSDMFGGLKKGSLYVGAARPKRGKSTMHLCMAADLGIHQGIPIGMVESEMEKGEQQDRLVAALSSVEIRKIETGLFVVNEGDKKAVGDALKLIEKSKIYTRQIPLFDIQSIINSFRIMKAMYGIEVGFFDQIKDTTDVIKPGMEKEHQRIGWLAFALKAVARELDIPIVANMQLSRAGIDRELASGNIDPATVLADSDRVLRLANSCYYIRLKTQEEILRDGAGSGNVVINVFAQRGGDCHPWQGGISYLHRKKFTRFEELKPMDIVI